jgi:hypothetical protein
VFCAAAGMANTAVAAVGAGWWHRAIDGVWVGAGAPQVMDRVRDVWISQDRRPEGHTKASESAMAVMD